MERIKITNLTKNYANQCVFQQVNISFYSGEIIGLIGENGVGKTTFIKLLCGLIHPDSGQVFINGININSERVKCMQNIGVLLEGSRSIYWKLSALQNFIYFSGLKGIFGRKAYERGERMLKLLDLWKVREKKAEIFSYGMKQRLAFACSISHLPSVILLDEPTTGLDASSSCILEGFIKQLCDDNKTIIIASHDHHMIERLAHKIVNIRNGSFNNVS